MQCTLWVGFQGDEHMNGEKEARQTGKCEEVDGRSPQLCKRV